MESKTNIIEQYITNNQDVNSIYRNNFLAEVEVMETSHVFKKHAAEGCENFFNYVEWLGLSKDEGLLIIPSNHHYYYEAEDLKEVRTVVNLKQLNHIKQIRNFVHNISHILPHKSYFIGVFVDRKNQNGFFSNSLKSPNLLAAKVDLVENGVVSRIPFLNMMYDIIDTRTTRFLTKRSIKLLFEDSGLKVLDMTELDGFTYFCTQKVKKS